MPAYPMRSSARGCTPSRSHRTEELPGMQSAESRVAPIVGRGPDRVGPLLTASNGRVAKRVWSWNRPPGRLRVIAGVGSSNRVQMIERDPSPQTHGRTGARHQRYVAARSSLRAVCATLVAALLAIGGCGSSNQPRQAGARRFPSGSSLTPASSSSAGPTQTTTPTDPAVTHTAAAVTPAAVAACRTVHLSLSLIRAGAAAGTSFSWYGLENVGPTACSMIGYPGVAVLDAHGRIVQHPATWGAALPAPVRLVTLKPGQRVQFLLNSTDTIPSPGCARAYRGVRLQVFPPNQPTPILKPIKLVFCDLRVGPVEPISPSHAAKRGVAPSLAVPSAPMHRFQA